jgi:hypothetical protein
MIISVFMLQNNYFYIIFASTKYIDSTLELDFVLL